MIRKGVFLIFIEKNVKEENSLFDFPTFLH